MNLCGVSFVNFVQVFCSWMMNFIFSSWRHCFSDCFEHTLALTYSQLAIGSLFTSSKAFDKIFWKTPLVKSSLLYYLLKGRIYSWWFPWNLVKSFSTALFINMNLIVTVTSNLQPSTSVQVPLILMSKWHL